MTCLLPRPSHAPLSWLWGELVPGRLKNKNTNKIAGEHGFFVLFIFFLAPPPPPLGYRDLERQAIQCKGAFVHWKFIDTQCLGRHNSQGALGRWKGKLRGGGENREHKKLFWPAFDTVQAPIQPRVMPEDRGELSPTVDSEQEQSKQVRRTAKQKLLAQSILKASSPI